MGLSNIEKKSFGYSILKIFVGFWHNIIYYKSYTIIGKENIPTGKPIIFTPNHQNALMDALALFFTTNIQLIFVARADIFKKPAIAKILYFLKILPIYRIRDGYDSVKKSKDIIGKTIDIINAGNAMVILPEGNHSGIKRLRPLKKGFARMAFETEESSNFSLDMQIVPVGIYYDNYQNYRSSLVVNFGEPIAVVDYLEQYKVNRAIAINQIKDKLSSRLKSLIINIESEDNYQMYNELRFIYRHNMAKILGVDDKAQENIILIDQQIINAFEKYEKQSPKAINECSRLVSQYVNLREKHGLTNVVIKQKGVRLFKLLIDSIALIVTLPVFIYGFIGNFIPYYLPLKLSKKRKDPQLQSSFKFVISMVVFPIYYIIQLLIAILVFSNWGIILVYLISLAVTAAFAWKWRNIFIKTKIGWNYRILALKKDSDINEIQKIYSKIISFADAVIMKK